MKSTKQKVIVVVGVASIATLTAFSAYKAYKWYKARKPQDTDTETLDEEGTVDQEETKDVPESSNEAPVDAAEQDESEEPEYVGDMPSNPKVYDEEESEEPEYVGDMPYNPKVYDEDGNVIGGEEEYTEEDWEEMEETRRREAAFRNSGLSASDYMIENGMDGEWMDVDDPDEDKYNDVSDYDILSVFRDDTEEYLMVKGENYLLEHPLDRLGQYFQFLTAGYDDQVRNDVLRLSRKQETWVEPEKWHDVANWQDPNSVVYDNIQEMRRMFLGKDFVDENNMHEITMVEIIIWFAKKFDYDYGAGEDKYVKWMLENVESGFHREAGNSLYKIFNDALEGNYIGDNGYGFVCTPVVEGYSREDYGDLMHQFWKSESQFDDQSL